MPPTAFPVDIRPLVQRIALCLLAGSLVTALHAQQPESVALPVPTGDLPLRFERFSVDEGLSQSTVTSLFQDHLGFMWFGTFDGLNRFDGVSFTQFKTIPFDSTSISANAYFQGDPLNPIDDDPSIYCITEDRDGHLWIGTRLGLDRFDRATETFTRFVHEPDDTTSLGPGVVMTVAEDRAGALWAGTWGGGLSRMDPERPGHFTSYRHDPADTTSLSDDVVLYLFEDRGGALWAGTVNGLNRMDPERPGHFTRYDLDYGLSSRMIWQRMVEDTEEDGVLWIISSSPLVSESSLLRLDTRTGEHQRYDLDGAMMIGLVADPATPGVFWISTVGHGLYRFEAQTGAYQRFHRDGAGANGLATDQLLDIYADRSGSVWVATYSAGVTRFDPSAGSFFHYRPDEASGVFGVLEDRAGGLWMGSAGRLSRLDRTTGQLEQWRPDQGDPFATATGMITTIYEDRTGNMWVGSWTGGLIRMERTTGRFTRFHHDPDDATSLSPGAVYDIEEAGDGTLWIGTEGGLSRMDRSRGQFTRFMHDPEDTTSLSPGAVWSIMEDRSGSLWVATSSGLSRMDRSRGHFTRFMHDPADATSVSPIYYGSVYEDRSGTIWVGTYGGLTRMDRSTGRFTHFTEQNSDMPAGNVMGILEDDAGYLWLSTNRGIARFDPLSETFRNFDLNDGLQAMEYSGGTSAFKSPRTGELFFGNTKGVTAFYPHHFETNERVPPVALTDFKLFNTSVPVGRDAPLTRHISETKSIDLRYDENAVSFAFAALHYKNAGQNQYQYKLEPYETNWVAAGTQRTATYTNLSPGAYVFRVKAANSDGVWNEAGTSIAITIHPPWWRTWWAYLCYGLFLLAGLVTADRIQRRRVIRRERERAHAELEQAHRDLEETHAHLKTTQAQLIQSEKMASLGQLTAGIAHEIKNPLNFVNNFSQLSVELADELEAELRALEGKPVADVPDDLKEILDDLKANAAKINEHGQRADGIVRSMLEHARRTPDRRRMVPLNTLLEEYVNLAYHGKRGQQPDFDVVIERDYDAAVGEVEAEVQGLGRVFVNLLNNAFDAVQEQARVAHGAYRPTVTVATRRLAATSPSAEAVEVRVSDNGPGISEDLIDKIFEPFFTTKPAGSGIGLGLSLSYDVVTQGHGGTLTVESREGRGTTFIVTLPL